MVKYLFYVILRSAILIQAPAIAWFRRAAWASSKVQLSSHTWSRSATGCIRSSSRHRIFITTNTCLWQTNPRPTCCDACSCSSSYAYMNHCSLCYMEAVDDVNLFRWLLHETVQRYLEAVKEFDSSFMAKAKLHLLVHSEDDVVQQVLPVLRRTDRFFYEDDETSVASGSARLFWWWRRGYQQHHRVR